MKMMQKFGLVVFASLFFAISAIAEGVTVGSQAPNFSLVDQNGAQVKLEDLRGGVVVLEWTNPDCPFVKRHYGRDTMKGLAAKYKGQKVTWLAINSTHYMGQADNKAFAEKYGLDYRVLSDAAGEVGKAYGAKTTPHMFIVDEAGKVVYQGAIDDDPYGNSDSPLNYVDSGLQEELTGKALATTSTEPYGCSVKYAG